MKNERSGAKVMSPRKGILAARTRGRILAAVLALVAAILAVVTLVSHPASATDTATRAPKTVEVVGPDGTPLNVVGGSITSVESAPPHPFQYEGYLQSSSPFGQTYNIAQSIPVGSTVSISSITLTCLGCTQTPVDPMIKVYVANQPDCSKLPGFTTVPDIAILEANPSTPTVEFTFPTPRVEPVGFTPTGPWCLGIYYNLQAPNTSFYSIDGTLT